jgi:uncharacterized membrane protein (UPF0136 family)
MWLALWLQPPRRTLAVFLCLMLVLGGALGWLSKKFPRTIGTLVFAVTAVLLFVILKKGITIGQITTAVLISTPLILAGACLFVRDRDETGTENETSPKPVTAG